MELKHGPNPIERVYDEFALLGKIFIQEVDKDLQPSTTLGKRGRRGFVTVTNNEEHRTYDINICKVSTDV